MAIQNGINANSTTPLPKAGGGTGVNAPVTTATAGEYVGWNAQANVAFNNYLAGYTTTVTAAGTTVLTVASTYQQFFTGATTQTVTMPVVSTLVLGQSWLLVNLSSGNVTVNSSGGNLIVTLAPNSQADVTCIAITGTSAASWNSDYDLNNAGVSSITGTANQVIASAPTGAVTLSLPQSIATTSAVQFNSVRFNTGNALLDANGNLLASITSTGTAVNNLTFANAAAAGNPVIGAAGSDSNIQLQLSGKGTSGVIIQGITSGSNAPAGYKGEIISAAVLAASGVAMTNNTARNITSISLTAGNWYVLGVVSLASGTSNMTQSISWCSLTSATLPDNSIRSGQSSAATSQFNLPTAPLIVNTSSTITCYLSGYAAFASGSVSGSGYIVAVRI